MTLKITYANHGQFVRYALASIAAILFYLGAARPGQAQTLTVPGNSGLRWVDTRLDVRPGTLIQLSASGTVNVGSGSFGPEGTHIFASGQGWPASLAYSYGLVARLTASRTNPQDELREDWAYGAAHSYCALNGGHLWLTVNDNHPADNVGQFEVRISTSQTCHPAGPPQQVVPAATDASDLIATGIEVTQAIQTYVAGSPPQSNQIPLIGLKRTAVRVYVRSVEGARGPWRDVTARLTVRNISGLYARGPIRDRFLLPVNGRSGIITASPTGSNRNTLDDSFLFLLDIDQTAPGIRELQVHISSLSGRAETNSSNNDMTQRVTFEPDRYMTMWGYTYSNRNNAPSCTESAPNGVTPPFSDFEAHRQYVENVYPVSSITIIPVPGSGTQSFDNTAVGDEPCGAYVRAQNALTSIVADMREGSERVFLLTPDQVRYAGWCCTLAAGHLIARGQDYRGDPGPTMAQEASHSFGGVFLNQHTFDPGFGYPRSADGPLGPYVGFRFSPTYQAVPGQAPDGSTRAWDYMSYSGPPLWVSPYTYCKMLDYMSGGSTICPSTVEGGGVAIAPPTGLERPLVAQSIPAELIQPARFFTDADRHPAATPAAYSATVQIRPSPASAIPLLYFSGIVDSKGGLVLEPFEVITGSQHLPSKSQGTTYRLVLEDAAGKPVGTFNFDPPAEDRHPEDRHPGHGHVDTRDEPRVFGFCIPWIASTARVIVSRGGKLIAERKVSAHAPEVSIAGPAAQGEMTGRHLISWTARDADGDRLTFRLEYSPSGGRNWLPLGVFLTNPSLQIDFDSLPGSDAALLRVLASDGVNTTEARSAAFRVPKKAPQIILAAPKEVTLPSAVIPKATAFDLEDGAITDPAAYRWTSDRDGLLGAGQWIVLSNLNLSPGTHTITVTTLDSDKNTAAASMRVTVPGTSRPGNPALVPKPKP